MAVGDENDEFYVRRLFFCKKMSYLDGHNMIMKQILLNISTFWTHIQRELKLKISNIFVSKNFENWTLIFGNFHEKP